MFLLGLESPSLSIEGGRANFAADFDRLRSEESWAWLLYVYVLCMNADDRGRKVKDWFPPRFQTARNTLRDFGWHIASFKLIKDCVVRSI